MAYLWLFCALAANMLVYLFASDTCEKTISLCTLNVGGDNVIKIPQIGQKGEKGEIGEIGENGQKGDTGPQGLLGDFGYDGVNGFAGSDGPPGPPGINGKKGDRGEQGDKGPIGRKGIRGDAGSKVLSGPPGFQGRKGITGDQGPIGARGPPGVPGKNGSCPCAYPEPSPTDEFGPFESPAEVLCKASATPVKTGEYFVGPSSEPIKVKCVNRGNLTTLTCIEPLEGVTPKTFIYEKKLWLSTRGLTVEDIYGISREQLAWLQSRSSSAYQTIRYHCLNSNPFSRYDVNSSLLLLSWDDRTIGPIPTLTRTFFYSVPTETDGCAFESEWKYTDIKVISNTNRRVPVTDFFIRDVRPGVTQSVKIEHRSLCFD